MRAHPKGDIAVHQKFESVRKMEIVYSKALVQGLLKSRYQKFHFRRLEEKTTHFQDLWDSSQGADNANESLSGVHKLNYSISWLDWQACEPLDRLGIIEDTYENPMDIRMHLKILSELLIYTCKSHSI